MKPEILIIVPPQGKERGGYALLDQDFTVHYTPDPKSAEPVIAERGEHIRALITTGAFGVTAAQIKAMPKLEFVQTRGMGFERIDFEAAKARGIVVANSRSTNYFAVAEHAMGLLIAIVRDIPAYNEEVHSGNYAVGRNRPGRTLIYGKTMGILGLGDIGSAIAERAVGFNVTVKYTNRRKRDDVPYEFVPKLIDLARQSDLLVLAAPGGDETYHLVNREVLEALGPKGFLVNVGRGTVVDPAALVEALRAGTIAGAALDVVEGEPNVPKDLLGLRNLIMTPHIAANAPESRQASVENTLKNLKAHFAGEPVTGRLV